VTDSNEETVPNDEAEHEAKPNWRPMALALVAASSARFLDWDSNRVVPVGATSEV
jgi:hypothetical protein